jgi:type I restriction enzyme S subunit
LIRRYFEALYRTPACRVELRKRAKGIVQGFWRLYTDDFYDIRVPIPPLEEQAAIMDALDANLMAINTAITCTEREIELLREYRTRLIADVVTGKIDVRQAAMGLPDGIEELPGLSAEADELDSEEDDAPTGEGEE